MSQMHQTPLTSSFGCAVTVPESTSDLLDPEIGELRLVDVGLVVQRDADPVDDPVAALLADVRADQPRLVAVHIVLARISLTVSMPASIEASIVGRAYWPSRYSST